MRLLAKVRLAFRVGVSLEHTFIKVLPTSQNISSEKLLDTEKFQIQRSPPPD